MTPVFIILVFTPVDMLSTSDCQELLFFRPYRNEVCGKSLGNFVRLNEVVKKKMSVRLERNVSSNLFSAT